MAQISLLPIGSNSFIIRNGVVIFENKKSILTDETPIQIPNLSFSFSYSLSSKENESLSNETIVQIGGANSIPFILETGMSNINNDKTDYLTNEKMKELLKIGKIIEQNEKNSAFIIPLFICPQKIFKQDGTFYFDKDEIHSNNVSLYSDKVRYNKFDEVKHQDKFYKAKEDITSPESFKSSKWEEKTLEDVSQPTFYYSSDVYFLNNLKFQNSVFDNRNQENIEGNGIELKDINGDSFYFKPKIIPVQITRIEHIQNSQGNNSLKIEGFIKSG